MEQDTDETSAAQVLTGKQEHYLKRELISQQVKFEILELNSPTALQRFGAPFKSDYGEVSPLNSELPILRYLFVHFVREFPFLDRANEKEFWQDKIQIFLQLFANKRISSSEDRLEETKRKKLSTKSQKIVELMMVSGIPTASGYEERIRFSEMEIVEAGAIDPGTINGLKKGNAINGWDINISGVRAVKVKKNFRNHKEAEYLIRVKRIGQPEIFVSRRYSDFEQLQKNITIQLPGRVVPVLPKKIKDDFKSNATVDTTFQSTAEKNEVEGASDESGSISSVASTNITSRFSIHSLKGHRRNPSSSSRKLSSARTSVDGRKQSSLIGIETSKEGGSSHVQATPTETTSFWREAERVSLRAFLRTLISNPQMVQTKAMEIFLTQNPIILSESDKLDISNRESLDAKRIEEQKQFYEIARKRAAELDVYMEQFRREIIESDGLTKLLQEVKEKPTIQDMSIQYRKFAEWLRIEVAATVYHLFLAEDNSPELYAQAKRIHSMVPYTIVKNAIKIANPAAVIAKVLDIFIAKPFGARSLLQRIFGLALNDGVQALQKTIDVVLAQIDEPVFYNKIKKFVDAEEPTKDSIRSDAEENGVDIIISILRSEMIDPPLKPQQITKIFNAYMAWNNAITNLDDEIKAGALTFSHLKQLLKLYTRQRDKAMMLSMIDEPVTLLLLRDLFTIFYEPLVRVYKTANIHHRVTDFANFVDDLIIVVDRCRQQDFSADPNQTVQAFIDLCARHEHNLYGFVHDVHSHDNGLFTNWMNWIEDILEFLRHGPKSGKLDINALFSEAISSGLIDKEKAILEIDNLVSWQEARKRWHHNKTRQKMGADDNSSVLSTLPGSATFRSSDFGLDAMDLEEMTYDEGEMSSYNEEQDNISPLVAERQRRASKQSNLRRSAGEPVKPEVVEVCKIKEQFLARLRSVLSE